MTARDIQTPRTPRPRRASLPPGVRDAARRAGAWGLSLCSIGVSLVVALSAVAVVIAVARWLLVELAAGTDGVEDAIDAWLASIDPMPWIVTIVVVLIVAVAVAGFGVLVSMRVLRRAGVAAAAQITWWCCGVGTVVQAGLSIVASGVTTVLGLLLGGLGAGMVVTVCIVTSTLLTALVGHLAGPLLWVARTQRVLERPGAADAPAVGQQQTPIGEPRRLAPDHGRAR